MSTKDSKDLTEAREKKRRRTIRSETQNSNVVVNEVPIKKTRVENVRALFYQEEEEAEKRDPVKDVEIHKATCDEIRKCMEDIKDLKESGETGVATKIAEKRIHGSLQFITLKKLNRLAHIRCKGVKDGTHEAKQKIDDHHLQLQNLLYETMHLQKEITKCLEFKSKDEEIDLVPINEFYKEAPVEITKPEKTKNDPHVQTLARLDWELEQRKRLSEKLTEAQSSKETISKDLKSKKEYLESLQPKLSAILQSTKPVQEYLGMPFDEIREQHRTAGYLPEPLYVLYMQAEAYKDACDKNLTVSIQGDVDVARALEMTATEVDEESDSDQEEQEKQSKKRRRRRKTSDRKTQVKQKLLKKHPLSIELNIKCKDGSVLHLVFYYLVAMEVITVQVKLNQGPDAVFTTISGGDLTSPDQLLSCLYSDDLGNDTPNPSNAFALSKLGLEDFPTYIPEVGHPYMWAQWLGGLQFLNAIKVPKAQVALSASYMEETIKKLRKRVKSRLALQQQLTSLERSSVPVLAEHQHLFPTKVLASLVQWKMSTYADFVAMPYTQNIISADLAKESDLYYSCVVERGSAKLTAYIVVGPDYPLSTPLFAVNVCLGKDRNNTNDENIRELESELNIYCDELIENKPEQLLANQIQRLLMCFDVYLETEAENANREGPNEFGKEKIFPRLTRGRDRGKPYKYMSQMGFFSQR